MDLIQYAVERIRGGNLCMILFSRINHGERMELNIVTEVSTNYLW